jgi:small subunit ribosomal protein S6
MQAAETQTATGAPPAVATHAPGTRLREYETIILLKPDLAEDLVDKVIDRLKGIVSRDNGKVIKVENWGKKKTAFEVKKNFRAIYVRFLYLGDTKMVSEFERNLRMTDDVLKYQTVKIADNVDPNARAVEPDVKLAGDPEVPDRVAREPEGFGGDSGFGGRDRDREIPDEVEAIPEAE